MAKAKSSELQCPCGSEVPYSQCCEPLHLGLQQAITAEQLMRSRYSAYVLGLEDYLLNTWHLDTRPTTLGLANELGIKWMGLKIVDVVAGSEKDSQGEVEFIARFKVNGKAERLHERSRFNKEQGHWFYIDGLMKD